MSARAWRLRRMKGPVRALVGQVVDTLSRTYGIEPAPRPNRAELARRRRLATHATHAARRKARHS